MVSPDSIQVTVKHLVSWNSIILFGQQRSLDALNRTQPSGLVTDRLPCSHFRWQDYWAVTATAGCSGDWGGLCPAARGTWSVGGWLQGALACNSRMGAWGASAHNGASQHPDSNTHRMGSTEEGGGGRMEEKEHCCQHTDIQVEGMESAHLKVITQVRRVENR